MIPNGKTLPKNWGTLNQNAAMDCRRGEVQPRHVANKTGLKIEYNERKDSFKFNERVGWHTKKSNRASSNELMNSQIGAMECLVDARDLIQENKAALGGV